MTEAQADTIIAQLEVLTVLGSNAVFMLVVCALGVGFMIGMKTWELIRDARKSRFF